MERTDEFSGWRVRLDELKEHRGGKFRQAQLPNTDQTRLERLIRGSGLKLADAAGLLGLTKGQVNQFLYRRRHGSGRRGLRRQPVVLRRVRVVKDAMIAAPLPPSVVRVRTPGGFVIELMAIEEAAELLSLLERRAP